MPHNSAISSALCAPHPHSTQAGAKSLEAKTPLGYIGTTEADCAPLIVLLVSDEGGYFTGQSYMVDGGIHKHS